MDYRKSADVIQKELLDEVSDSYEKSKGFFLWDILKAVAIRIKGVLELLTDTAAKLDIENLAGAELERFVYQRTGVERKAASYATGLLLVYGNGVIRAGDFFETAGLVRFVSIETVNVSGSAAFAIRAVNAGSGGNVPVGAVIKMPVTIQGIVSCVNEGAVSGGYEAESDSDLRIRYYDRLKMPATSGNAYHYLRWAKEVTGVGDAKVFSLYYGDNTVRIVIINQDRLPADNALVYAVQSYIDPNTKGTGEGEAPIGAFCFVESAIEKEINVSADLTIGEGFNEAVVKQAIIDEITHYLASIAFKLNYLSYARLGAAILNADGVMDYENLLINGNAGNIECEDDEVMALGDVDLSFRR